MRAHLIPGRSISLFGPVVEGCWFGMLVLCRQSDTFSEPLFVPLPLFVLASSNMSAATTGGAYIPPHLRNRPAATNPAHKQASPVSLNSAHIRFPHPILSEANPIPLGPRQSRQTLPSSAPSRTPWSTQSPAGLSRSPATSTTKYEAPARRTSPVGSRSAPGRNRPAATSPTLYVYGDSFVGPMKLLREENVKYTTFKGASAKVRSQRSAYSGKMADHAGTKQPEIHQTSLARPFSCIEQPARSSA